MIVLKLLGMMLLAGVLAFLGMAPWIHVQDKQYRAMCKELAFNWKVLHDVMVDPNTPKERREDIRRSIEQLDQNWRQELERNVRKRIHF
jgi:hypothetical protein